MRTLLFRNENRQEVGRMIRDMWEMRSKILKDRVNRIAKKNTHSTKQEEKEKNRNQCTQSDIVNNQTMIMTENKVYNGRKKLEEKEGAEQNTIEKINRRRGQKQEKDRKNYIQIKVVKDQEVKLMRTIKKGEMENRKKRIQVKVIKNQEVKIMKEMRGVKQLKAVKEENMTNYMKKQEDERGK